MRILFFLFITLKGLSVQAQAINPVLLPIIEKKFAPHLFIKEQG